MSQPLQSTPCAGGALHFDAVTAVVDTLGVPAEVDADGVGAAVEAEGVGEELDVEGVGEVVDAVGLDVLEQYSPGLQGVIVAAVVGQYAPGLQGASVEAESVVAGVGASTDPEGASDAVPGATSPFSIVFALAGALLTGAAPSLPPQPARTSTPRRRTTPAAALLERRVFAVTPRTAHPQSPALQPDEKPVRRLGSRETYILRHVSQRVGSIPGGPTLSPLLNSFPRSRRAASRNPEGRPPLPHVLKDQGRTSIKGGRRKSGG